MFPLPAYHYLEIIAFIVGILTFSRSRGTPYRLLPWLLLMVVCVELTGRYMRVVLHLRNAPLYNVSTTLEFMCYADIFRRIFQSMTFRKRATWFIRIYPAVVFINMAFIQGFDAFHSYTMALGSFFMIIFCCLYFYEVMVKPEEISLHVQPMFWISTGILFFYLGDIAYDLWYDALVKYNLDTGRKLFDTINNNLILVLYFCFILALLCLRNRRSSSYR